MSRSVLLLLVLGTLGCEQPMDRAYSSRSHDGNVDCWMPTGLGSTENWTESGNMCHAKPEERAVPKTDRDGPIAGMTVDGKCYPSGAVCAPREKQR